MTISNTTQIKLIEKLNMFRSSFHIIFVPFQIITHTYKENFIE